LVFSGESVSKIGASRACDKHKNLYELHRGINKNRIEWEKEHQQLVIVIENKCCEKNKNNNVEV
jgi:hypothetical protein